MAKGERMSGPISSVSRRRFLQSTALGVAATLHAPAVLRAQGAPVKIGVLHPVSGALAYSGQQGRIGAQFAIEEMNAAGVAAVVGGYASGICLAASQTAARYDLPYVVDVGVVDSIVTRGLKNTFRFGPGFGVIAKTAIDNLITLNDQEIGRAHV